MTVGAIYCSKLTATTLHCCEDHKLTAKVPAILMQYHVTYFLFQKGDPHLCSTLWTETSEVFLPWIQIIL